jgi:hypothetical protein
MNTSDFIDADSAGESFSDSTPEITFQGNNYDLTAIIGATGAAILLISCGTLGLATYCLPVAALIVGFIGLRNAKDAVNPERTRQLSWVSIGVGGVILLGLILLIILYVVLIAFGIAAGGIENF